MDQQCKVCGEPAAGFHFGAFTCEGCKSFFGRSYNNLSNISDCKNSGECVINKKNRTACKACRLKKCFLVGMSKSGSRYGRRSNWFKIHCLLQKQQEDQQQQQQRQHHCPHQGQRQQQQQQQHHLQQQIQQIQQKQHQQLLQQWQKDFFVYQQTQKNSVSASSFAHPSIYNIKDDPVFLGYLDDGKNSTPPLISSPESHNSDSSIEVPDRRAAYGAHPGAPSLYPHLPSTKFPAIGKEMMNLQVSYPLGMPLIEPSYLPSPGMRMFSSCYPLPHSQYLHHSPSHPSNLIPNSSSISEQNLPIGSSKTTSGLNINDNILPKNIGGNCHNGIKLSNNNNNFNTKNQNITTDISKEVNENNERCNLSKTLKNQQGLVRLSSVLKEIQFDETQGLTPDTELLQDNPIDLSMKAMTNDSENGDEVDNVNSKDSVINSGMIQTKPTPIDLTIKSNTKEEKKNSEVIQKGWMVE